MPRTLPGHGFVYDMITGALVSRATVVATPLPPGLGLVEAGRDIDIETERWDAATRMVVPHTNVQRAAALRARAAEFTAAAILIDAGGV